MTRTCHKHRPDPPYDWNDEPNGEKRGECPVCELVRHAQQMERELVTAKDRFAECNMDLETALVTMERLRSENSETES